MKITNNKIQVVTCINNTHTVYDNSFSRNKIKVGKAYKCIDELVLTSKDYYLPEFALLKGITIKSHVGEWGWVRLCLPKDCFRGATESEIRRYKILSILNLPFRYMKILFFKIIHKADRIVRAKYYRQMVEDFC